MPALLLRGCRLQHQKPLQGGRNGDKGEASPLYPTDLRRLYDRAQWPSPAAGMEKAVVAMGGLDLVWLAFELSAGEHRTVRATRASPACVIAISKTGPPDDHSAAVYALASTEAEAAVADSNANVVPAVTPTAVGARSAGRPGEAARVQRPSPSGPAGSRAALTSGATGRGGPGFPRWPRYILTSSQERGDSKVWLWGVSRSDRPGDDQERGADDPARRFGLLVVGSYGCSATGRLAVALAIAMTRGVSARGAASGPGGTLIASVRRPDPMSHEGWGSHGERSEPRCQIRAQDAARTTGRRPREREDHARRQRQLRDADSLTRGEQTLADGEIAAVLDLRRRW